MTIYKGLDRFPQFILWREETDARGVKIKRPIGDITDPANWMSLAAAESMAQATGTRIGFAFSAADPFFFLDLDGHHDGQNWSALAVGLAQEFAGCFVEVSNSGRGLHIIGRGAVPDDHACKNAAEHLELYHRDRFVALTGSSASGDAWTDAGPAIARVAAKYFAPRPGAVETSEDWTEVPAEGWAGEADDEALIARALASKSSAGAFGGRATFRDLWEGNAAELAKIWPGNNGADFDHSSADAALCAHLAFWTGKNCARIDRLFRASALMRDKWEDRADYGRRTIIGAVARTSDFYTGKRKGAAQAEGQQGPQEARPAPAGHARVLGTEDQREFFKGCVYVRDLHRVFIPDGSLLHRDQFRAHFGGRSFTLDAYNEKTTRNAFEAFTENQAERFARATAVCFRPERAPGEVLHVAGEDLVNVYVPIDTPVAEGDPGPFLAHLARLIPDEGDRVVLLSWMAAAVQYPGIKFQWAPLLQGVEGNGKTFFIRALSHAIGEKYTHLPNAADLGNKFNAWILNKLFIGIEEVNVGDKQELLDTLKPLITNDRVDIQGKGENQKTGDNRANFFLCSNHKLAIRKTNADRRYCVFYTAQQKAEDIQRDGMRGGYFPALYRWAREGGYAIVNNFLRAYQIPAEFNPAGDCHRAPDTTSTGEALTASLGGLEQDIMEAVEEGRPGFCGGWVSSMALDRLLEARRDARRFTPHRRKDILEGLGFVHHPGLVGGRVNMVIAAEGGKPRLFVKADSTAALITGPADISRAYQAAQGWPV